PRPPPPGGAPARVRSPPPSRARAVSRAPSRGRLREQEPDDQLQRLGHGAVARSDGLVSGLTELLPELLVREEMRELAAELGPVADDERGARRLEEGRRLAEVRRVRAHQHGLPAKRRLEHVVAAGRDEAPADEDRS